MAAHYGHDLAVNLLRAHVIRRAAGNSQSSCAAAKAATSVTTTSCRPSRLTTPIDIVKRSIVQAASVIEALCVTMYVAVELLRH